VKGTKHFLKVTGMAKKKTRKFRGLVRYTFAFLPSAYN
jgi:hypothetical protein